MLPYPSSMQQSLARVSAGRSERAREHIPRLSYEGKMQLLEEFHPDYCREAFKEILLGPNEGDTAPNELVHLLHSKSLVKPEDFDLSAIDLDVDVLVIGGGGGGSAAALAAQEAGAKVLLATKLRHGDANTVMAEGGLAAAVNADDTPVMHYLDTIAGGQYANLPDLVEALVLDAPLIVEWFEDLGVMFDRDENGVLLPTMVGGHSRRRLCSCKDYSGLELMRVLRDEARNRRIEVLEFSPAVELVLDDQGRCAGAILLNLETNDLMLVRAKAVILATGGLGRLHIQGFPTTNHYGATADGLVIAYRAGAELIHVDTVQFHPTGVAWPEQMFGWLVTEALRGEGAQLVNVEGERFIHELESRDTVSSAMIRECSVRGKGINTPTGAVGLWLDVPLIDQIHGKGKIENHFAGIFRRFKGYGIDVTEEPLLVYPTQHYQNGGIRIDIHGRTSVEGLYAVGEVSGGVQGRNRLGGNSLADIFVFGRRAGLHAGVRSKQASNGPFSLAHVVKHNRQVLELGLGSNDNSPRLLPDYTKQRRPAVR